MLDEIYLQPFQVKHLVQEGELPSVSRETEARLDILADLVLRWTGTINLISSTNNAGIWSRHILDSLQAANFVAHPCQPCADLGSGAGFPGLVLSIVTGCRFHLIEADKRRAGFLVEAARLTAANVEVLACRVESCGLRGMSLVTSRALAPLTQLLDYAAPLLSPAGKCVFLKGENASREIDEASLTWTFSMVRIPSRTRSGAEILCLENIVRV